MSIEGIHHLAFTVADVEKSARFYEDVLGFKKVADFEEADGARRKVVMVRDTLATRVGFVEHRGAASPVFDEKVTGLDHVSFLVSSIDALVDWERRFREGGVEHSPIADSALMAGAKVLVFRDPDNIQLEFYAHP